MNRLKPSGPFFPGTSSKLTPRKAGSTLAMAVSGTFIALITYTGPLGNLSTVARSLNATVGAQTWILSSMSLSLAATLLIAGAVADRYGRARTYSAGNVALAVGAVFCAVAPGSAVFLIGRMVDGVAAAALIAASLGLVAQAAQTPAERGRYSGIWGASVGAGIACGPIITGLFDEVRLWRLFYAALALAGAALALASRRSMPERPTPRPGRLDLKGAILLSGALVLVLVALTDVRRGLGTSVIGSACGGAFLLAAFVLVERTHSQPMLDLNLFRHPGFTSATIAALGTGVGVIGLMSYACTFFMVDLRMSSLHASVLLLCWSGTSAAAALLARRLPAALRGSRQLAIGLAGIAIGELAMLHQLPGNVWHLVPGLTIAGVASGVLNAGLGREAVITVPQSQASLGSGANNTARYFGSSLGVTLIVILVSHTGAGESPMLGWNRALAVSSAVCAASALLVGILALGRSAAHT